MMQQQPQMMPMGGGMAPGSASLNPFAWMMFGHQSLGGPMSRLSDNALLPQAQVGSPLELAARRLAAHSMRATGGRFPSQGSFGPGLDGGQAQRPANLFDLRGALALR